MILFSNLAFSDGSLKTINLFLSILFFSGLEPVLFVSNKIALFAINPYDPNEHKYKSCNNPFPLRPEPFAIINRSRHLPSNPVDRILKYNSLSLSIGNIFFIIF